jgi:hypothetical protein
VDRTVTEFARWPGLNIAFSTVLLANKYARQRQPIQILAGRGVLDRGGCGFVGHRLVDLQWLSFAGAGGARAGINECADNNN